MHPVLQRYQPVFRHKSRAILGVCLSFVKVTAVNKRLTTVPMCNKAAIRIGPETSPKEASILMISIIASDGEV